MGLLAVAAVSMIASASASPPPAACGGTVTATPNYCVAGFQLENSAGQTISEEVSGTNGPAVLKTEIASVKSEIKCSKGKSKGTIENGTGGTVGKSTAAITFEECKLVKPANCKLTEQDEREIKTSLLGGELVLHSGGIEDKLKPKSGSSFALIIVEGKESSCMISHVAEEKSFAITGSQRCGVDKSNAEAETETIKHELVCNPSGGSLEIGTNSAEMTDEATLALSGAKVGDAWSIKEHT
ncbi:MAG TPA: hypothetical protein VGL54_01040 [Solirubrobacteraceae bacterium]